MCLYKIIVTKLTLLPLVLAKHKLSFLQNHCYKAQYVGLASVWETQHICQVLDIIFSRNCGVDKKPSIFGEEKIHVGQNKLSLFEVDTISNPRSWSLPTFSRLSCTSYQKKKKEEDYLVHQIKTNLEVTYMY